jgi:hypothetical protein
MSVPYVISETNLSHAWGRALWHVAKNPGFSIQPLVISIRGLGADGDPLRDNAYQSSAGGSQEIDGYRFHDCVHFALKRKRKSNKSIDDAEDGARAQIVDEMIVKLTHSYAVSVDRARLLDGRARVGMDLLKQIESLADGLEVRKNRLWEWEKAILLGYETFGKLRRYGRGRIRIDLTNRSLQFSELQDGEGEQFPAPR